MAHSHSEKKNSRRHIGPFDSFYLCKCVIVHYYQVDIYVMDHVKYIVFSQLFLSIRHFFKLLQILEIDAQYLSCRLLNTWSAVLFCCNQACWLKRYLCRGLLFFRKSMYRKIFLIFNLLKDCTVKRPEMRKRNTFFS